MAGERGRFAEKEGIGIPYLLIEATIPGGGGNGGFDPADTSSAAADCANEGLFAKVGLIFAKEGFTPKLGLTEGIWGFGVASTVLNDASPPPVILMLELVPYPRFGFE